MVQGLAALAVHDPDRQAVDDGYAMAQASGATRYGSVRLATEDALTWVGPCHRGDGLGIAGDEVLVVRHDITAAARGLIDLMLGAGGELVTVLLGDGVDQRVGELLAEHVGRHPRTVGVRGVDGRRQHIVGPQRGQIPHRPVDPVADQLDPAVAEPGLLGDHVGQLRFVLDVDGQPGAVPLGTSDVAARPDDARQIAACVEAAGVHREPASRSSSAPAARSASACSTASSSEVAACTPKPT